MGSPPSPPPRREARDRLASERQRLSRLQGAALTAPVDGMVWRIGASDGERLAVGDMVVDLVDCRAGFILASIPQDRFGDVEIGGVARFRLSGERSDRTGRILGVMGESGLSHDRNIAAAPVPRPGQHRAGQDRDAASGGRLRHWPHRTRTAANQRGQRLGGPAAAPGVLMSNWTMGALVPALFAVTLPYLGLTLLGPRNPFARTLASATCVVCGLRYLWWRWTWPMPDDQAQWQQIWAYVFLLFESATILSSCSVYGFMMRTRNRSADVDARSGSRLLTAPVDVFVATYNEDRDILERTLVGATSIEHPDLRVWVLDDGARPWVAELAAELGCLYTSRVKGKHAKAGNVNNGLAIATSTGRKPEFILLLDADFIAARHILRRTLPLFEEADVGIVQTPQHFFNPDPIQANLLCATSWPDEQRFFYSRFLAAKDAWGTAFCCGTSAVFRVAALQACGGMATATVTEDMLTSFRIEEEGYRTVFLNEQLSLGLAPEGLLEYTCQRSRWCLGAIQQCYTR